jgi:hypothetical protein
MNGIPGSCIHKGWTRCVTVQGRLVLGNGRDPKTGYPLCFVVDREKLIRHDHHLF